MEPIKRVEIIIDSPDVPRALEIIRKTGVSGYTLIENIRGGGDRGERRGDDLTSVNTNSLLLIACDEEKAKAIVHALQDLLATFGGVILVSDAVWMKH